MQVKLLHSGKNVEVKEVGSFNPKPYVREKLEVGETGYFTANIKEPEGSEDGRHHHRCAESVAGVLPGFKEIHPMVFSGIYPINTADYEHLKANLGKLQLNDSAFVYQPETSVALGFGFRCGFLGLLHLEIVQERLRREYGMDIIATYPSVIYKVTMTDGTVKQVDNPAFLPEPNYIAKIEEPMVKAFVICPNENIGDMMALISEKRGAVDHTETLDARRVMLTSLLPLNEILIDFHDRIKSITRGYGSMDYEHTGYRESDMVKLDMLVNGEPVDAFSCIVHRDKAEGRGRALAAKLKEVIPRQQYQVAIQAAIGGKIVARETVRRIAQGRDGEMLRRRHHAQTQAAGKTKGRQETHEILRHGQHPAGSLHRSVEGVKSMAFQWFLSKTVRQATAMRNHVEKILNHQRDILSPQAVTALRAPIQDPQKALPKQGETPPLEKKREKLEKPANKWPNPHPPPPGAKKF